MTGNRFVEVDYSASSCVRHSSHSPQALSFRRPESPFAVSAAIPMPHPRYPSRPSRLYTGLRQNALLLTPLHYFELHLTCLAWPPFFFLLFTLLPPLVLFVYYCCKMNQTGSPGRHCMKRTDGRKGQSVPPSQLGSLGLDSSCGTDINALHVHMRCGCG